MVKNSSRYAEYSSDTRARSLVEALPEGRRLNG